MKIETRFDIGERVVWRTAHNSGRGTVAGISIDIAERPTIYYRVKIDDLDLALQFAEQDLVKLVELK